MITTEQQIQFVLDVTARAAKEVIEEIKECGPVTLELLTARVRAATAQAIWDIEVEHDRR